MSNHIFYKPISDIIFSSGHRQGFIPFLGAGVSVSAKNEKKGIIDYHQNETKINKAISELELNGISELYARLSLMLAFMVQAYQNDDNFLNQRSKNILCNQENLPSSGEIAQMLSEELDHDTLSCYAIQLLPIFKRFNFNTGIEDIVRLLQILRLGLKTNLLCEPLSNISQYFEYKIQRSHLWDTLQEIFHKERQATKIHNYLAKVAKYHTKKEIIKYHYLILTTNYDNLMEKALDECEVPYVVITLDTSSQLSQQDQISRLYLQFSKSVNDRDKLIRETLNITPKNFALNTDQNLAILFKIHGSLNINNAEELDNIIISDNDYISFIRKKLDESIPGIFIKIFKDSPFLFLGYSLGDWNIRSFFLKIQELRPDIAKTRIKDFAILTPLTNYDKSIFDIYNIDSYDVDLNDFIGGLEPYAKIN